jgi:hypothetical protein
MQQLKNKKDNNSEIGASRQKKSLATGSINIVVVRKNAAHNIKHNDK